ncbi:hypothetical protein K432DRAFT_404386 [Lepidopterella palustris CBS 459.81]|uniref:RING-type domain-containing protein n=1 Tax=Lepidopterella palustris CBS 459.81 TaxID=1314670 RepID=A0A8E2JFK8_9PEZI|nr:hypothetical protein K432DRAFT_404386 [Lepidopterella palustris CBS 459.81]
MSVTTSAASVEPPPLLFGQRSPSPPSFSSPPQSPHHLHHPHTPLASPPPHLNEDVDMNASTTLQPSEGQNHDRDEDMMVDSEVLPDGPVQAGDGAQNGISPTPNGVAGDAAADEDAMDTTPDASQVEPVTNGSPVTLETLRATSPPSLNGNTQEAPAPTDPQSPVPVSNENLVQLTSNGTPADPTNEPPPPPASITPVDPTAPPAPTSPATEQPPPPPPPAEATRSDSDSSDEEEAGQSWHPIQEDTSIPDERELKEIEEAGEVSALDHEHWEQKTFLPLEEPEYVAGPSGRIDWTVDNYNGTKEKPNKELVMKSQIVTVGGYDWQIKFYPKGNDSDYLSIYVECVSVASQDEKSESTPTAGDENATKPEEPMIAPDNAMPTDNPTEATQTEPQHTPLPLLIEKPMPKRQSVAAQVSVVLYNPDEPRVNYVRTCLHRFCSGSPDWGWTRYHGPYYEIQHRQRGQRQALLRNDKLAFTSYIRIVDDETGCLWEHNSRDNPWDSFAMTGLQGLTLGEGQSNPAGNFISAISSWMLFKPFRMFLYEFKVPDFLTEPFTRPKPLIAALQKLLYLLRTQVQAGAGPVGIEDVMDALEWYGIQESFDKMDVIEVWETLRYKMEDELRDTPYASVLDQLFGMKKDYMSGVPNYRVPVKGVSSMQEAVTKAADLLHPTQSLPQLLTLELDRQEFDLSTRTWIKLVNKVTLDDQINVRGTGYTLYGFVVHKENLQSYLYHPVLRPEGPNSKWYSYTDGKDENKVICLTTRQAVNAHEGKSGSDKTGGKDPVAYIAMYVRNDVAELAFSNRPEMEKWQVPGWLLDEVKRAQAGRAPPSPFPAEPPVEQPKTDAEKEAELQEKIANAKRHVFQVIDSKAFLQHEGPGTIDAYDARWSPENSDLVYTVELTSCDGCKEVRDKLSAVVKDIKDPRQIKFWFLDALRGTAYRPNLLSTGKIEYSSGSIDHYEGQSDSWSLGEIEDHWAYYRIWVHVIDFESLPELPKEEPKQEPTANATQVPESSSPTASQTVPPSVNETDTLAEPSVPPAPENVPASEDTPMSEPDEPVPEQPQQEPAAVTVSSQEQPDQEMATDVVDGAEIPAPGAEVVPEGIPVVIPAPPPPVDTEMGGTSDLLPPPPPPADLQNAPPPPPPAPTNTIPDEIYFFLKFFDAEAQTLTSRGSHIAPKSARVDTTVISLLSLAPDASIELHEEEDLTTTHPIRPRRSFAQNDLHNTSIIIATLPLTEDQRSALASRAAFADPQPYLSFRAHARNFPTITNGHFISNYFSAQYYKGEVHNGHKHGHGTRIYHTGATYTGSFQLSQRHGHGLFTYQNGDTYDGDWAAGLQHGTGTFVEASTGNTYVGGWKNDKKFGEGVTHWKVAQETERMCRICWEEGAEAAFYDCGHVVACLGCARRVDVCPVCRKRVLAAMKLYYVA